MDPPARRDVAIQPKSIEPTPAPPRNPQHGAPQPTATVFAWSKDTGKEVPLPEKRTQTKEETQRTLRIRQIGACADCRAAKKRCVHVGNEQSTEIRSSSDQSAITTEKDASSTVRSPPVAVPSEIFPLNDGMAFIETTLETPSEYALDIRGLDVWGRQGTFLDPHPLGAEDSRQSSCGLDSSDGLQLSLPPQRSWAQVAAAAPNVRPSFGNSSSSSARFNTVPKWPVASSSTEPESRHLQSYAEVVYSHQSSTNQNVRMPQSSYNVSAPSAQMYRPAINDWLVEAPLQDAWSFDPGLEFSLFDEPISRYLEQEEPHFAQTSTIPETSQLITSPEDSMDASSTTSSIRRSKREIMGGAGGDYRCQHCAAGFRSPEDRRHHEHRVHLPYPARPFACPHCDRRHISQKDLNRHISTHRDRASKANFFCRYAGCRYATVGFARKDHLNRHMATHAKADSGVQMSRSSSARTFS